MTVSVSDITSGPYTGNDIADTFSYDFTIKFSNQLTVYETAPSGVITELVLDSDYNVNGVGDEGGGTITRVDGALPAGYEWFIVSSYNATQLTDFESQGGFYPDVHESAFDKLTYLILQLLRDMALSLKLSKSYSGNASTTIPDPSPRKFLRWDSTGMFLENVEGNGAVDITLINKIAPDGLYVGQTAINVADIPISVDVLIGGSMLHESAGDYTYSATTGNIVLAAPLTSVDIVSQVEVRYGEIMSQTVSTGVHTYASVASMKDADATSGATLHTSGYRFPDDGGEATYTVYDSSEFPNPNEANEISLDNGLVAVLRTSSDLILEQWGCSPNPTIDSRPYAQAAIEFAQKFKSVGGKRTITSLGGTYTLGSVYPDELPSHALGKRVALWVEDSEWCRWDLKDGRFIIDTTKDDMKNLDEILCVCQESGDQAFMYMVNTRFDGGIWADPDDRPDYNIRADYNVMQYSYLSRINCRRAKQSNARIVGFVYQLDSCDFRFAKDYANYDIHVSSIDGSSSTRTGYCLTNCVADYAGLYGYMITGGSGVTYASLNTCTADHIGRDDNGDTIVANIPLSAAYRLNAAFGVSMTSCGAEWSTRFARLSGCHGVSVGPAYVTNIGATDGTTVVDANIKVDGFCDNISLLNIDHGNMGTVAKKLQITLNNAFNTTQVTKDSSIPDNETVVINQGADSSAPFVAQGVEAGWSRGVRNVGISDSRLAGMPEAARGSTEWFDHSVYTPEMSFRFESSDTIDIDEALVTLTNSSNIGYVGFFVEILVGRSSGNTAFNPEKYVISAACAGSAKTIGTPVVTGMGDSITNSVSWDGDVLKFATVTNFVVAQVKVTAITRVGAAKQTFRWGA